MIYLILAALCSASMAVALRLSEGYSSNKYAILTGNCDMYVYSVYTAAGKADFTVPDESVPGGSGGWCRVRHDDCGTGRYN